LKIETLAALHRLPAIYPWRFYAAAGGLVAYAADLPDQYRLAAGYVDRILKGEKPADLPVQAPHPWLGERGGDHAAGISLEVGIGELVAR
jgi:hypothetical protein